MPSLAGAVTLPTALGVPGSATTDYTKSVVSTPRPDSTIYTRLSLWGVPSVNYADFTGRAAVTSFSFTVPVSLVPVVSLGEVTDVDLDVTASVVPVVTVSAVVGQAKAAAVSIVPVLTWSLGGLVKTGDVPKAAAFTLTPVVTVSPSIVAQTSASITLTPVATVATSLSASDTKSAAISVVPALDVTPQLNVQLAAQATQSAFSVVPVVTVTASVVAAGDVDRVLTVIRPVGRISTRIN